MSLSHNISNVSAFDYPLHAEINYWRLVHTITAHYYTDFLHRLAVHGYTLPITDYFHTYFNRFTPASFVTDNWGYPVLRAGTHCRWLIFHHTDEGVKVYVGRYVAVVKDGLRLYGDSIHAMVFPLDVNGSVVGVSVTDEEADRFRIEGIVQI